MPPPLLQKRWLVWTVLAVPLLLWLAWYAPTYIQRQREAVLLTATGALSCPASEIHIGPSRQEGDGPSEMQVEGCGRRVMIFCDDEGSKRGMIGQYFAFDISCRVP